MFAQVAVDVPIFDALTYRVDDSLQGSIEAGQLVQVPFRNKTKTGVVVELSETLADESLKGKVREIVDIFELTPLLTPSGLDFLSFVADYYYSPIGEVVRMAIPAAIRVEGIKRYRTRTDPAPWDDLSSELQRALDLARDGANVRDLVDELGTTFRALSELERLGLVDVEYVDDRPVKPKTETWYSLTGETDERRLGSKQSAILDFLTVCGGDARLTDIRERHPSPYSSLSSLEERGFVESREEEVYRDPFRDSSVESPGNFEPTAAQLKARVAIDEALASRDFKGFLLHGVTGSGKTEVYVHIIKTVLAQGRRALVLLPEIALTPQFVSVFRGHFGDELAVLHSGLSTAQRFDQWRRIQACDVDIVIGARSAIFAPLQDLGVIVVDEEHDTSFKQENGTRYNARDLALLRGKLEGAVVVLGSATPSLESRYNVKLEKLEYLEMPERVSNRPMPIVEIVDMRGRGRSDEPSGVLSGELQTSMTRGFDAGLQSILFLNRRGFSPCVICESCGHRWMCPNCDVSLTYHRRQESLRCHHCDYSLRLPEHCPECGEHGVGPRGIGTEQLEMMLRQLYPEREIGRLDRDTGAGSGLRRVLREFSSGRLDVLVGTQMVTKGHDFPGVTTVGVVAADQSLNFPDFRAAERTFQLMTQVAGRAGRGDDPGIVYIQALNPEHYSLSCALNHDYESFARQEMILRKEMRYPPFTHMIALKFESARESAVMQAARDYAFSARRISRRRGLDDVVIVGPALAPIERLKGRTRFQLLLRAENRSSVRRLVHETLEEQEYFKPNSRRHGNVRIAVDVDPQSLL